MVSGVPPRWVGRMFIFALIMVFVTGGLAALFPFIIEFFYAFIVALILLFATEYYIVVPYW